MKNNFENIFIQELLDSEFVFAKTRNKKFKLNSVNSKINFKKKNQFQILDLFELNTSLKQLIRILFSLKYSKTAYKSDFVIYIWCLNPFILNLADSFISEYNLSHVVLTLNTFPSLAYAQDSRKKKHLFVIGDPWSQQPKNMLNSHIIRHKLFLVNTLNFKWERHEPGFYKIQNNLEDYKKLLVLLIIIESILNQSKEKIVRRVINKKIVVKKKDSMKQKSNSHELNFKKKFQKKTKK